MEFLNISDLNYTSMEVVNKSNRSNLLIVLFILLLIMILVGFLIFTDRQEIDESLK